VARVDTHGRGGIRQAFYRSLVPNGFVVTVIGAAMIVVGEPWLSSEDWNEDLLQHALSSSRSDRRRRGVDRWRDTSSHKPRLR